MASKFDDVCCYASVYQDISSIYGRITDGHTMHYNSQHTRQAMGATQAQMNGMFVTQVVAMVSSYLVCQYESGLEEIPETLHLNLHLTDRRVKADEATPTHS